MKENRCYGIDLYKTIAMFLVVMVYVSALAVWAGWSIYNSYHKLTVNEFVMESDKLDGPVTFAVLSDLHENRFGEQNEELMATVFGTKPDGVLLVGDMINSYSEDASTLVELAKKLVEQVPVFFTWGNHEMNCKQIKRKDLQQELEALGVVVLNKTWQDVELAGQKLRIGGLYGHAFAQDGKDSCNPETMRPEVYKFLTEYQDTDQFKLMLSHQPENFVLGEASVTWNVDLVVSGHLHGGQVVVPFMGGMYGGDQGWFPEYVHGLYEKDLLHILITSGLGSGNQKLVPRFNNLPEVAVLKLVPAK